MRPEPAEHDCDVVIAGGGMAGVAAAIAAVGDGLRVLLVERNAFLGGAATAGSVGQFVGWETRSGRRVIAGVAERIVEALRAEGGAAPHGHFTMSTGHVMDRVEYDPELLKIVLDRLVGESGAELLFNATVHGVEQRAGRLTRVHLATPSGPVVASAPVFVDASGDLALLSRAGAAFLAPDGNEGVQPATLMFAMAPVDFAVLDGLDEAEKRAIVARGVEIGALPRAAAHRSRVPGSDTAWFNVTRVDIDPDDPFALSRAEVEGRRQALAAARFLKENLPGLENAALTRLAPQLGIRDARRVKGDHVLTRDELAADTLPADTVACGAYPIDIHHPAGSAGLTFEEFGPDHYYGIPLRSLIPSGFDNVLTAGRGVSATHEAFAALRVMPTAMALGHAAGAAARLAVETARGTVRRIDVAALRGRLRDAGAFLGA